MKLETSTLESMCELVIDCPHSTPKWTDSGIIVLRNQNIRNGQLDLSTPSFTDEKGYLARIKRAAPQAGDIVFTREAPMGAVCIIPRGLKCCLGQRQVLLRPKADVCGSYLYWALQSPFVQHQVSWNEGTGTTVSNVRIPVLKSLNIPRNGKSESVIAEHLSALSDKIQLNHQINQTLEKMAQALFKSWLVDFEPVKAKIAALEAGGNDEDALLAAMESVSGKTADQLSTLSAEHPERYAELRATAELFPSAMQDSELGEIPQGWGVAAIKDFGQVVCGKTPAKKQADFYGSDVPFIKIPDMHGNVFATKTSDYLSSEGAASQPKKAIPKGSVCVSCIATVGQVVIATEESHTNQQINSIVPSKEVYTPYLYFRIKTLYKHLHDLASGGSATLNLNTGGFSKIRILMPSEPILAIYHKHTNSMLEGILSNVHEAETLSVIRNTLLPKLLSGELTLPDTDEAQAEPQDVAHV